MESRDVVLPTPLERSPAAKALQLITQNVIDEEKKFDTSDLYYNTFTALNDSIV